MAWLNDNPPARSQFRSPRRDDIRCVVVHTSEQPPDLDGEDTGTLGLAGFIKRRSSAGSYHQIVDSDSTLQLVEDEDEAYGARYGWNRWSLHISHCTKAALWNDMPLSYVQSLMQNSAAIVADWCEKYKIPVSLITKADGESGKKGIISHARVDPTRRTDPGWSIPQFNSWLAMVRADMNKPHNERHPTRRHIADVVDPVQSNPHRVAFWSVYSNGYVERHHGARLLAADITGIRLNSPITGAHYDDTAGLILLAAGDGGVFRLGP